MQLFTLTAMVKKVFNKAKNHKEAELWDIRQQINMTPEERQRIARELKNRYYGVRTIDVREKKK